MGLLCETVAGGYTVGRKMSVKVHLLRLRHERRRPYVQVINRVMALLARI
jgi:hypothetical protein